MKLLLVSYAYPPVGGAGMIRAAKWAKFLPALGWDVTVVAPERGASSLLCPTELGEHPRVTVIRTPNPDLLGTLKERLRGGPARADTGMLMAPSQPRWLMPLRAAGRALITMPDENVGWYRPALAVARPLMRGQRFDAILSSSPPETSHLVARALSREFRTPWVAELRDPWSGDHYRRRSRAKRFILRWMERRVLRDASALVTVSEEWRAALSQVHGAELPTYCIPHGFDEDDHLAAVQPATGTFVLTYTGSLHREHQDPEPFLAALGDLVSRGTLDRDRVRVRFFMYGGHAPDLGEMTLRHGLTGVVEVGAVVEYRHALAAQQAATVLVLFQWRGEPGIEYVKSYEYLGARRPVLVVGSGEGALGRLIRQTRCGVVAPSRAAIAEQVARWYEEYLRTGTVAFCGDAEAIRAHSRRARARDLADVLSEASHRSGAEGNGEAGGYPSLRAFT